MIFVFFKIFFSRTTIATLPTTLTTSLQSTSTTLETGPMLISSKEENQFQQNPFLSGIPLSPPKNVFDHVTATSSSTTFTDNGHMIFQQQQQQQQHMSIFNNKQLMSDDVIASHLDFRAGNGYQKLPTATTHDYGGGEEELIAKLNRMHTQSPQLPRKTYATLNTIQPHFLPPSSTVPHESPRLQPKFHQHQQPDYHNHYQQYQPPHHPYKPLPQSTFSPVVKKRYGVDGNMVSEDLEFRILHGNTSPIVLQRFYHQQKQFRDQNQEELRAMQMAALPSATTNSQIPISRNTNSPSLYYNNRYGSSPARNNQYESNYYNNASPQHYNNYIPRNGSTLPYKHNLNSSPMHSSSQYQPQQQHYHHQQPPQIPMRYDRPPIPCPSSPQLDRLRANLEKPNFYERHQLPVEVHLNQPTSTSNGVGNEKSKGML
jgi:hypothetical protein